MKLYELIENTEIQSEYKVVYVEDEAWERTEIKDPILDDSVYYSEINYICRKRYYIYRNCI